MVVVDLRGGATLTFSLTMLQVEPVFSVLLGANVPASFTFQSETAGVPSAVAATPSVVVPGSVTPVRDELTSVPVVYGRVGTGGETGNVVATAATIIHRSTVGVGAVGIADGVPSAGLYIAM